MALLIHTLLILLLLCACTLNVSNAALTCYSCSNCGTEWDVSKASIVTTSGPNDYCRKTVAGPLVSKDFVSSCTSTNVLGTGIFCCQTELCNSAQKPPMMPFSLGLAIILTLAVSRFLY